MKTTHTAQSWQELLESYSDIEQKMSHLKEERSKRFKSGRIRSPVTDSLEENRQGKKRS
jgi:hypothetical protein